MKNVVTKNVRIIQRKINKMKKVIKEIKNKRTFKRKLNQTKKKKGRKEENEFKKGRKLNK